MPGSFVPGKPGPQDDMPGECAQKEAVILIPRSGRRIPVFGCCQRAALCALLLSSVSALATPPSVLLITVDTLRADHLGCYGYSRIETPALDGLAREGIRFEHAYAQVPITLPSHAVILTGTYPMFNGVRDFTSNGLPTTIPTLAEVLRRRGYRTAAFVSSFAVHSMWGLNRGFETYDDQIGLAPSRAGDLFLVERRGDRTVDRFLAWLSRAPGRPFFVWLHLYDPHSPYQPPEPYRTRYSSHPYDGEIAFDDAQLGKVFARLQALGLYRNTFIVLASDHGESLGEHGESEHGFFVYNSTLRVPLILKPPEATPQVARRGGQVTEPVGTVDIAPTIAQVAKVPAEDTRSFQGRSLLRFLGRTAPAEAEPRTGRYGAETVYAESFYPRDSFGWHELRALVTSDSEYIDAPQPELYDLRRDPEERTNAIGGQASRAGALREKLEDYERRFAGQSVSRRIAPLDPETLEKLRSLGYVGYRAPTAPDANDRPRADPKDKIATLDRILRAGDLTRARLFAEADRLLENLERDEPELYVAPFERGENDLAWGKPERALEEFRKSLSANPTFDQSALGLGRAYFSLGDSPRAALALELALKLNPRNFLARLALAKVYWREDQLEKAAPELARVVQEHPDFPEAHADYGIVLAKQGKYREARAEIRRGTDSGFRDSIAYDYLGIAYAHLGEPGRAIEAYRQAIALDPRYAAAYLNLALEYRKQGQLAKAQNYFRKTCQLSEALCRQYAPQFTKQ